MVIKVIKPLHVKSHDIIEEMMPKGKTEPIMIPIPSIPPK